MPKVPILESPQVAQRPVGTPYMNARPTPGAFGAGVGQQLQQSAQQLGDAARESMRLENAFRVDKEDQDFAAEVNELLRGERGILNQEGENAFNSQPVLDEMEARFRKRMGGLANDEQRQRFDLKGRARIEQGRTQITTHVDRQRDTVFKATAEGAVGAALRDAVGAAGDGDAVESAIQKALVDPPLPGESDGGPGPLRRYWKGVEGLPAGKLEEIEADFRARVYEAELEALLAKGDGLTARARFEAVKDRLGVREAKLRKAVEATADAHEAEVLAQGIAESSVVEGYKWLDRDKAAELLKAQPPEKRARVGKALETLLDRAEEDRKAKVSEKYNEALSIYEQNGHNIDSPVLVAVREWLLDPPNRAAEAWHRLRRADLKDKNETRDAKSRSNQEAMAEFLARPDRDKSATNIDSEFTGRADAETRHRMRAQQNAAKDRLRKFEAVEDSEFSKLLDATIAQNPGLKSDKQSQRQFKAWGNNWILRYRSKHKEDPPAEAARKAIADKLADDEGTGWLGIGRKPKYKTDPGAERDFPPEEAQAVPPEDRKLIEEALRARGRAVTEDEVLRLYRARPGAR
jgi:hypothetical protein